MTDLLYRLKPWQIVDVNNYKTKGFARKACCINAPEQEWNGVVLCNDTGFWFVELPYNIIRLMPPFAPGAKTPEALMFKIDLLLLEDEAYRKYNIEDPFIFPMNDL